jgi:hypothetical protein
MKPSETTFVVQAAATDVDEASVGLALVGHTARQRVRIVTHAFPCCRACANHMNRGKLAYALSFVLGTAVTVVYCWRDRIFQKEPADFAAALGLGIVLGIAVTIVVGLLFFRLLARKGAECTARGAPVTAQFIGRAVRFSFSSKAFKEEFARSN